jgi:hypothetical protein
MKTVSGRLVMAVMVLGWTQAALAQTADEVIEKHLTAAGGRAALGKLNSRSIRGTITLSTPIGDVSGPIEVENQVPNKSRTLITLDLSAVGAGTAVIDQRFDGTAGYAIDSVQGNRDITGDLLETMKNGVFPSPLLNYKELGAVVELGGKEKIGARDAYLLIFKPRTGSVVRQYVDADSYLVIKAVIKLDVPPVGELEQTTELLDYRDVDGIKVPFQVKSTSRAQSSIINITTVEHNRQVDEALFSKPATSK